MVLNEQLKKFLSLIIFCSKLFEQLLCSQLGPLRWTVHRHRSAGCQS